MMRPSSDSTSRTAIARRASSFTGSPAGERGRRQQRRTVTRAALSTIETLEGRQMLATVSGNQIGVYQGPDGPVKISITGRGTFDFVGATRNANGGGQLNDIPMTIFDTGGRVIRQNLGGFGGLDGIAPIDEVIEPDPSNSSDSADAIAVDNRGRTYGVVLAGNTVAIDRFDFSDGGQPDLEDATLAAKMIALVQSEITPDAQIGDITRIIGADFDPSTSSTVNQNLLWFAANYSIAFANGTQGTERVNVPVMFTYNVSTHDVDIVRGEFGFQNEDSDIHVADFTFINGSRIAWFGSVVQGDNGNQEDNNGLYITGSNLITDDNFRLLRVGPNDENGDPPEPLDDVASIEFVPGSNFLYVVDDNSAEDDGTANNDSDDDAVLDRFTITGNNTNRGTEIGNVDDPDNDPNDGAGLGDNLDDLAWNSRLEQNFFEPGKRGTMLGLDTAVGQIAGIDVRERFANTDLFAVYARNVSSTTSIAISNSVLGGRVTDPLNTRLFQGLMQPFAGSAGDIRVGNNVFGTGGGTGGLFLGLRLPDQNDAITLPVTDLPASSLQGGSLGFKLPNSVRPGIFVTGSLRDFYFAGTITGSVRMAGSVDTFYAGNVLTGDASGGIENADDNFYVDGDIRNLVVTGGIGTTADAPGNYVPGTDLRVNGRIQQVKSGDNFQASADIVGNTSERSVTTTLEELENVPANTQQNAAQQLFQGVLTPAGLGNTASTAVRGLINGVVRNDSFNTPQILGSFRSALRGKAKQVDIVGEVDTSPTVGDAVDFYGVPMMAGDSMVVQLQAGQLGYVSVIDPDGRVYATDQSNQNGEEFLNGRFAVKADKPGVWRIAVRPLSGLLASVPYELTVDNVGDMAIGGLVSLGNVFFNNDNLGMRTRNADLGAILSSGQLQGTGATGELNELSKFFNAVQADKGNIRSLEGSAIGASNADLSSFGNFPTFLAPRGSIGLIRANAADPNAAFVYFNQTGLNTTTGQPADALTIGGNYQVIEAQGDYSANLSANGGIGVIRVGSVANRSNFVFPGYVEINADSSGKAEMGLFDCVGDFGTLGAGGPAFSHGNGGNFRYLRIGGRTYADAGFSAGTPDVLTGSDEAVNVRDDSGTTVRITPVVASNQNSTTGGNTGAGDPFGGSNGTPPDPFGGNGNTGGSISNVDFNNPFGNGTNVPQSDIVGELQVNAYPVRSSGVIIYNVASTTGVNITTVGKRSGGGGAIADVTSIRTGTAGAAVVDTGLDTTTGGTGTDTLVATNEDLIKPTQRVPLTLAAGQTLDVILNGSGTLNVYEIGGVTGLVTGTGEPTPLGTAAQYTRVINNTSGEIVNVVANSVGRLEAARLGVAAPVAGTRVEGLTTVTDARYRLSLSGLAPFNDPRVAIRVGNAIDILSRGELGTVAIDGDAQNVMANSDGKNDKGQWEGITGTIYAEGSIRRIDIGEGLATSGSGDTGFGGILANRDIGLVTNVNGNGDLRGDIQAGHYLEGVRLTNGGSIIDADIYVFSGLGAGANGFYAGFENGGSFIDAVPNDTVDRNEFQGIGDLSISGNGGILNTRVISSSPMGRVSVDKSGFGVFTSTIASSAGNAMAGITAGGLGIRGTLYGQGSFVGDIKATGDGKVRRLTEFSKAALQSANKDGLDSKSGIEANAATDLYLYLKLDPQHSKVSGVTDDGVIEDSILSAARAIKSVSAWEIRSRADDGTRPRNETYPMQINFADQIGTIHAGRDINGARIVGGTIEELSAGRDMQTMQLQATSDVEKITVGRNVLGTARFNIIGEGALGTFQANGYMNGTVFASQGITAFIVKGDLGSEDPNGGIRTDGDIGVLRVGGNLVRSASIRATKAIKDMVIDGDIAKNATIRAASFGKVKIGGTEFGKVIRG